MHQCFPYKCALAKFLSIKVKLRFQRLSFPIVPCKRLDFEFETSNLNFSSKVQRSMFEIKGQRSEVKGQSSKVKGQISNVEFVSQNVKLHRSKFKDKRSMPWGRDQGIVGVDQALGAWQRPWGRGHGCGGVAKALGA